jgi:hypothetical protein
MSTQIVQWEWPQVQNKCQLELVRNLRAIERNTFSQHLKKAIWRRAWSFVGALGNTPTRRCVEIIGVNRT